VKQAIEKLNNMQKEAEGKYGPRTILITRNLATPTLCCKEAAIARNLNLEVSDADARCWWNTGLVPFKTHPDKVGE
jgi:hypothetical protein